MENLFSVFGQLMLYSVVPFVLFGLAVYGAQCLFGTFVTRESGEPLVLAVSVLSVPIREAGHAIACLLFAHRIEAISFFDPHAENGEYGYVDHSYNPKNPLAVIGNFFFAVAPVALGLFVMLAIMLTCFRGAFFSYSAEIRALSENGAPFSEYLRTAAEFFPSIFRNTETAVFPKIIGCILLLFTAFSVLLSPSDLIDAFWGLVAVSGLLFVFCAVLCLFDDTRVSRMITGAFRTFFMYLTALFSAAVLFALALAVIGLLYATVRGIFMPSVKNEEEEEWNDN